MFVHEESNLTGSSNMELHEKLKSMLRATKKRILIDNADEFIEFDEPPFTSERIKDFMQDKRLLPFKN